MEEASWVTAPAEDQEHLQMLPCADGDSETMRSTEHSPNQFNYSNFLLLAFRFLNFSAGSIVIPQYLPPPPLEKSAFYIHKNNKYSF